MACLIDPYADVSFLPINDVMGHADESPTVSWSRPFCDYKEAVQLLNICFSLFAQEKTAEVPRVPLARDIPR